MQTVDGVEIWRAVSLVGRALVCRIRGRGFKSHTARLKIVKLVCVAIGSSKKVD